MNKIIVTEDNIELSQEDKNIQVSLSDKLDFYDIVKLNIIVLKSAEIEIEYKGKEELKLDITIEVKPNVEVKIEEIKQNKQVKIQYKYFIYDNSNVTVNKFYDASKVKELDLVCLNGLNAKINMLLKSISKDEQQYDMVIYHNFPKTESHIENKLVTIKDGSVKLNVTSIVYNKIKKCILSQNNRIINMNNQKSTISPNLLIEENDVEANHSAYISKFSDELIYYMQTRGISEKEATKILIKGFLNTENPKTEKIINKYWR